MKKIMILMLASISLLLQSCGPSITDIKATDQVEFNQTQTQQAEQAAAGATQAAMEAEKTAAAMTQTAMEAEKAALIMTQTEMAIPKATAIPLTQITVPNNGQASCPFYVYQDWGADANHYVPEGWMGDTSDIKLDDNYKLDPERPDVIQIAYEPTGPKQWSGVYWWDPAGSYFGDKDGGFDLSCAKKFNLLGQGRKGWRESRIQGWWN